MLFIKYTSTYQNQKQPLLDRPGNNLYLKLIEIVLRVMCVRCFLLLFFVTFPCCVLEQEWYWIVLNPDLCLLTYFYEKDIGNSIT